MKPDKNPCVYIMTNACNTVLYTGVTRDLIKRISQHKSKMGNGFASRYNVTRSVYVESLERMDQAIAREKQIKGGSRRKKIDLINNMNPEWKDLYEEFFV